MSLYRLLYGRSPGYPLRVLWHATRSQPREETSEGKREVEGGEVKSWRQEVCASSGYREISYPGTTNNSLFLSRPVLHRCNRSTETYTRIFMRHYVVEF